MSASASGQLKTACSAASGDGRPRPEPEDKAEHDSATAQQQSQLEARRAVGEDDRVRSLRKIDGPEGDIGGPDGCRLAVDGGRPAGVERVGQDEIRGRRRIGLDHDMFRKVFDDPRRARDLSAGRQWAIGIFDNELVAEGAPSPFERRDRLELDRPRRSACRSAEPVGARCRCGG